MLNKNPNNLEFFIKKCKVVGLTLTEQRHNILKVIVESKDHPTAETIYSRANLIDNNISLATVYRAINLFESYGLIEKLKFDNEGARYEIKHDENDHHHHLIDLSSGKIIEFYNEEIEKLKYKIAEELGYKLVDHRLELFGIPLNQSKNSNSSDDSNIL